MSLPAPTGQVDREDPPMSKDEAGTSAVNIQDILTKILALDPKDQQQVLAYLKK